MEEIAFDGKAFVEPLFNSQIEAGIRATIILDALHPRSCDLAELTWFDYIVVHTGDLGGPVSLHPDLPAQAGELLVRRRLVEESLRLMQQTHLIDSIAGDAGIEFIASDDAPSFVNLLQTDYSDALKERAKWIASHFSERSPEEIRGLITNRIGRWTAEFLVDESTVGMA